MTLSHPNPAPPLRHALPQIVLYAATLFISALLMFVLQPLFGKLLLPLLGGSPAVWNTCMVFYQSVLFLGYGYAHMLSSYLPVHRQVLVHGVLLLVSFVALPVALPHDLTPPNAGNPTFWLLWVLLLAIGLPFFVVSTTAPLMQKWFAQIGHRNSNDPYFLYAASNSGSLLALLAYPFLLEPNIGLAGQKSYWSVGFVLLCLLVAGCAAVLWQNRQTVQLGAKQSPAAAPLSWSKQLYWLALAFVPSSLLLGLTNFISTDIASVPLLWIIPLTLYLLSFVLVFAQWNDWLHPLMVRLQALFLVPFIAYAFINPADLPYWMYLVLHLIAFFFAIMVCHGELAKQRPPTEHLTRYYLVMSFAGMLGGLFNTFAAPVLFNGVYEYPIMIIAALLLRPGVQWPSGSRLLLELAGPGLLLAFGLIMKGLIAKPLDYFDVIVITLIFLVVLTYTLRKRPLTYALVNGVVILLALGVHGLSSHTLFQQRTFFGVLAVRESELSNEQNQPESYHELFHGTTKHGAQRLPAELSKIPLTYYSQPGPMGQLFKEFEGSNAEWRIGVVGLGAGALACYAKPSQQWTFYEIDPLVVDIAKNDRYFSYLSQCAPHAAMRVADARLSLAQEPDQQFDLLVMDAFSSDAVPTHLLTQEALRLYFRKLKPNGILAFHITNRHLLLKKVLSIHAEQQHWAALLQEFVPVEELPLVVSTDWVVMARQEATLQPLALSTLGQWQKMPLYFDMPVWTDDFTNIVRIWK